jgi:hypothetical protein
LWLKFKILEGSNEAVRRWVVLYLGMIGPCRKVARCYTFSYAAPAKIVRLAQTFGAGVSADDTRGQGNRVKPLGRRENEGLLTSP